MICEHYNTMPFFPKRWPNFLPKELACRHCDEAYYDEESIDMLQKARTASGIPYVIRSAHRCSEHNLDVGGAEKSQHLLIAFDIATEGHDREALLGDLIEAGFASFGFYEDFIHADKRQRSRRWFGSKGAEKLWKGIRGVVV